MSLEATALPAPVIIAGIITTFNLAGLYGVAVAVATMLALAGMVVALDAFGPVTDNAGGIAEMAGLPKEVRQSTDALDAVGNTTKAVTKGYAIGSAGLARWCCSPPIRRTSAISPLMPHRALLRRHWRHQLLARRSLWWSGCCSAAFALSFGGISMTAAGRAAQAVVVASAPPVPRPPGDHEGTERPDYGRAVDMLTRAAIREMIVPSLLPVLSPIVVFLVVKADRRQGLRLCRARRDAARCHRDRAVRRDLDDRRRRRWDNAKKSFEDGYVDSHGTRHLKGSEAHKASVTGDTVGDPYKDTAGPAVNPMIKITNIVALLLLAVLAHGGGG